MTRHGPSADRDRFLRRAIVTTLASRAASTAALLAITPVLTRQLGDERYGVLATLTTASLILGLANLGVGNGIVSRLAVTGWGSPAARPILSAATAVLFVASGAAMLLAALLAWLLPWPELLNAPSVDPSDLRAAALLALLGTALTVTAGLGQQLDLARQRGHAVALWTAASAVSAPAGAAVAAALTDSLPVVVGAAALLPPAVLALQTVTVLRSLPRELRPSRHQVERGEVRRVLGTGSVFLGLAVVTAVAYQADTLIVSATLDASAAAAFSIAIRLFGLVSITMQTALQQLWTAFAEALGRGELDWVRRALVRYTVAATAVAAVVSLALIVVARSLVGWWLGPGFTPSVSLLVACAAWTTYTVANHPVTMLLNGAQLQGPQLMAAIPMAVANVALSVVLTREIGSAGPLIGSLVAHAALCGVPLTIFVLRRLRAGALQPAQVTDLPSTTG